MSNTFLVFASNESEFKNKNKGYEAWLLNGTVFDSRDLLLVVKNSRDVTLRIQLQPCTINELFGL